MPAAWRISRRLAEAEASTSSEVTRSGPGDRSRTTRRHPRQAHPGRWQPQRRDFSPPGVAPRSSFRLRRRAALAGWSDPPRSGQSPPLPPRRQTLGWPTSWSGPSSTMPGVTTSVRCPGTTKSCEGSECERRAGRVGVVGVVENRRSTRRSPDREAVLDDRERRSAVRATAPGRRRGRPPRRARRRCSTTPRTAPQHRGRLIQSRFRLDRPRSHRRREITATSAVSRLAEQRRSRWPRRETSSAKRVRYGSSSFTTTTDAPTAISLFARIVVSRFLNLSRWTGPIAVITATSGGSHETISAISPTP